VYIGKTNDLRRRLKEHNNNQQTSTRHTSGKWNLIYAEVYKDKKDADVRERKLKQHGSNKRWLYNRIKHSLMTKSTAGRS
jgi:putative endonuclease